MTEWIDPKDKLPPQGKKVLSWREGDCCVVQRFGDYWIPIPFTDSKFADTEPPEKWAEIDFPVGFTGMIRVIPIGGSCPIDMDEYEKHDKEQFDKFVAALVNSVGEEND
jgi:hypothetical protein